MKFTNGMDCPICHNKHSSDKYTILNDISYVKEHFISYCLQMNKTQKQMIAAVCRIDATWGTNINNDDTDDDDDDDDEKGYSHTNTDNDADFQEEEE